jgi:xanthine dehydrogenase small subunit
MVSRPSAKEIDDCLSGNLCRCTGYRPIIDAAQRMTELPKWRSTAPR